MSKSILIALGIIVIAGIGFFAFSGDKSETSETPENEVSNSMPVQGYDTPDMLVESEQVSAKVGSYESYSAGKVAIAATDKAVLFFHASWCPSCKALNGDIEKNLSAIPAGVTILKTDYDKETELKKKYGVTHQHTLVQVDKDGKLIKKWSGGSKLENLLSQIQ